MNSSTTHVQDASATPWATRTPMLGHVQMDQIHAEFEQLLGRAASISDSDRVAALGEIDAHLRVHFEAENRWMVDSDFPGRGCHIKEHDEVLRSSAQVLALARHGDARVAKAFIDALSRWFPPHADHLDSALAAWISTARYGGKPVVLHRAKDPADH